MKLALIWELFTGLFNYFKANKKKESGQVANDAIEAQKKLEEQLRRDRENERK